MIRLTAKERVSLHLLEYEKYAEAIEVPPEMTQDGVARAAGFDLAHFAEYVRPLVKEGLVRERTAHVKGALQRRKVYDLTEAGRMQAIRLREKLRAEPVRLRDGQDVRDATLAEVLKGSGGKVPVLEILRRVAEQGIVDLSTLAVPFPSFVEMLPDMPRPARFVGRQKELEEITGEKGPRIFVVRGVAGIGKSMLAARACEMLRGRKNLFWRRVRSWDALPGILASLAEFLAALGKPSFRFLLARGDASQAAGLLREDLRDANAFLVFDDVHEGSPEVQSVFEMLAEAIAQGADVRMLVLTRESPTFYGWRDTAPGGPVREIELQGLAPGEIELLVEPNERDAFLKFGNRIGGHPLFLELVRAHAGNPAQALKDIWKFIEVEVFRELSAEQRTLMKTSSLYRVPVPREALFSDPRLSHDVLVSLEDKSLIRPVGEEAFEVHDTVREFFAETLTSSERDHVGRFAVGQLRSFALRALEERDFVSCLHYVSNALELSKSGEERGDLNEILGDAQTGIGNLSAARAAYEEAAQLTNDPEKLARRCRKPADSLSPLHHVLGLAWGFEQVEAGFRALGDTVSVERGWLHLALGHLANHEAEFKEAQDHGLEAVRVFQAFGEERGVGLSLCRLGEVELDSPDGDPSLAGRYLQSGVDLLLSMGNSDEAALGESLLVLAYGLHLGDAKEAMRHIAAGEGLLEGPGDPYVRRLFFVRKGLVELYQLADIAAAKESSEDVLSIERKLGPSMSGSSAYVLGQALFCEGRWGEARLRFEEIPWVTQVAPDISALRILRPRDAEVAPWVGLCYALEGDLAGFERRMEALEAPTMQSVRETASAVYEALRGIRCYLRGDMDRMHASFKNAVDAAEGRRGSPTFGAWLPHFVYGVALRLIGQEREASARLGQAEEYCRKRGFAVWFPLLPQMERRLTAVLRQWRADSAKS